MMSVAEALAEAERDFVARNPQSEASHQRAAQVMPGGNTRTSLWSAPFPLTIASGEGCRITDVDGHIYVDLVGEFTAGIFGHSSPVLAAAVAKAHANGINLSSHNTLEVRLAELIAARFPSIDLLRFTNSGTEANLMALMVAKAATGRSKIVVFDGGYHGGVLTFAGGGSPVNAPLDFLVLPYNDIEAAEAAFAENDIAAVLVEPMLGAGGCHPARQDVLEALRRLTREHGAVLIFDEVQTARMAHGGVQARTGVTPDMTTLGKFFGGGLAFGCFGGRRAIMETMDPRRSGALGHAGTFNNNTLTMAAGIAAIETYLTADNLDALFARGEDLRARLNGVFTDAHAPYHATGMGSILTIHGDDPAGDIALRRLLQFDLGRAGYHIAARGLIALSLPVSEAEIAGFLQAVGDAVAARRAVYGSLAAA
ncbi:aminotransferase class III-fold pyridoxal phosphate-dependent enzyme [Acuticoccus sp. M5D2P5]|uniref:aspartate aminotransferase family protein n=1 Tax=Acuticoccus kalidii TaxID=2910977 RepID=UPI001F198E92|nr:aminotransferase class III-fold pyridoxal phosphate-dependent enzyme [Acuticoccus kalidii]MCF3931982.1 aminotransferase class III-fold pyridoxal phosphate-dependent enzyme [Acuticoccus kalidii]